MGQKPSLLTPTIQQTVTALARRQLLAPALLYAAGHRPVAFAAGQSLALAEPFAALLGVEAVGDWVALLSDPAGPSELETALRTALDNTAPGIRGAA
jgi:hypothetical protein